MTTTARSGTTQPSPSGQLVPRVHRVRVQGRALVSKSARGAARATLRREAEVLRCLRGAGAVELVALREQDDRTDLVTVDAGEHELGPVRPVAPDRLLRVVASSARSLAELHRAGWYHGAICSEHLLVDARGTTRWCSLGSAGPIDADRREDDVTDLLELMRSRCASWPSGWSRSDRRRWRRLHRRLRSGPLRADRSAGEVVLEDLADEIDAISDGAAPLHPSGGGPVRLRPTAIGLLAAVGAVAVAAMALGADPGTAAGGDVPSAIAAAEDQPSASSTAGAAPTSAPTTASLPSSTDDVVAADGLVRTAAGTFRVGRPGDRAATGDWDCDGRPTLLLLRPDTGEVFHFDRWASADRPAIATTIRVVAGASELVATPTTEGCLHPTVLTDDGLQVDPFSGRPDGDDS
jgi:hypothetical protein